MTERSQIPGPSVTSHYEPDARFMMSVLAASNDCIKVLDLEGRLTFMSEGGMRVMEVSDFNALRGCPWPSFWEREGHRDASVAIAEARAGRSYRFEGAANTAAGNPRYWDVQVSPILGADGQPHAILSVSRDISELQGERERYQLLASELNHRIKNMLAMVHAIVNQTMRLHRDDIAGTRDHLAARMHALGQAQDVLMTSAVSETTLGELSATILEPYGLGQRVRVTGPETRIASRAAMALALAIHELATNAVKYGALSGDNGLVEMSWDLDDDQFRLSWVESGGPPVAEPVRRGFGSQVIEKALSGYLAGTSRITYEPQGVRLSVEAPIGSLLAAY
ncbi:MULTISPECIES: HWE histidine kinase domain-containing protein [Hyphomicrobiales]|jgi:two-component sensor histidine kinase|uniref:histidine kinase n=1 Tax=Bosea massiliensis TaxID=151419 RepID=A0ABW0NWI0_9HYPH|nr:MULTISPECIES: HWE histidine kinase domain-containing protein [Hyphomicrobiales]